MLNPLKVNAGPVVVAESVSPKQMATQFPNESLTESNGKLFCLACREELALKRSVALLHVKFNKHIEGKERLGRKEARERDIAEALQRMDES